MLACRNHSRRIDSGWSCGAPLPSGVAKPTDSPRLSREPTKEFYERVNHILAAREVNAGIYAYKECALSHRIGVLKPSNDSMLNSTVSRMPEKIARK